MSTNLVSDIAQNLSSTLVKRIAETLGLDSAQVESALRGGIPALLAALTSLVSSPKGATALSAAVAQQQPGILSNLANIVGSTGQKAFIDSGANTLKSLLGGSGMSAIAGAVGKYAGINEGISKSLMGMLGPMVLGGLAQQQQARGLDATGLAGLLTSQKDNIMRAMPAGLAKSLGDTGLLDAISGSAAQVQETASSYSAPVSNAWKRAETSRSGSMGWLLPVLGALAVIALGWRLLSPAPQETASAPPPAAPVDNRITTGALPDQLAPGSQTLETLRGVKAGDVDIGQQTADALTKLRASLQSITDETSAQTAVAPLKQSADEFNRLSGMLNELSPANRALFAKAVAAVKPTLNQLFDKALQIPEVSTIIKPTVDSIRSEIDTLATA
jgi:hypothetical protein